MVGLLIIEQQVEIELNKYSECKLRVTFSFLAFLVLSLEMNKDDLLNWIDTRCMPSAAINQGKEFIGLIPPGVLYKFNKVQCCAHISLKPSMGSAIYNELHPTQSISIHILNCYLTMLLLSYYYRSVRHKLQQHRPYTGIMKDIKSSAHRSCMQPKNI